MTFAPQSIKDAREYLLARFDMHPGNVAADLDPDEVGIVGDPAHKGGYHCGRDRTVSGDYSVTESPRDRAGLSLAASALDVGLFDEVVAGQRVTLRSLSLWLVDQCRAGAPDTLDIREIIYSPDGKTVRRWDRLGRRTSGDSSHLIHTHISYFRDSEGRSKRPLFERFVASLHGAATSSREDDDMKTLMRLDVSPAVFLTDGLVARHVADEEELRDVKTLAEEGSISVHFPTGDGSEEIAGVRVRVVGDRRLIGRIVGKVPEGFEDLAATVAPTA